jgi:hypothetical protein
MEVMTFSALCKCGLLTKWSQDRGSRFVYQEDPETLILVLSTSANTTVKYCPSCGGPEESSPEENSQCTCGSLKAWADDPDIFVRFDRKFNEYYLLTHDRESILLYYCPVCGGESPKSKRGEFFTRPLDSDVADLKVKLGVVKSLNDVVAILGAPDKSFGPHLNDPRKKAIYDLRDVKETIKYLSISETFDLTVEETTDGQISMIIEGKPKDLID